ncbi:MAG TPA: hypothetical protein VJ947_02160, partial [Pseudohaliea sp.]|nr:hypothetical protein [Pseudohaliea sp.]
MMRLHLLLLAFWLPALASAAAAEETIVATVSSRLEAPSAVLPGQRVIYEVEILSNALSFQGLRVVPPAVSGGLLLSDAAATVKGTRRVAG